MKSRLWGFFRGTEEAPKADSIPGEPEVEEKKPLIEEKPSANSEIDDLLVGKVLTADLFNLCCADLGYDFELYTDWEGRIYRFRRIPPKDPMEEVYNGGTW